MSFVYLLVSTSGSTYVGATVDLERRLRQHNKEINRWSTCYRSEGSTRRKVDACSTCIRLPRLASGSSI